MRRRIGLATGLAVLISAGAWAAAGVWLNVPFVRQPENGCGAACIVMVMQYWASKDQQAPQRIPTVASVDRQLYNPRAHGIVASEMRAFLEHEGFRVFTFQATDSDLMHHLSKGRPLIVCLRQPGLRKALHYVVVVGFDPARRIVVVNDPAERKLAMVGQASFDRRWAAVHHWTLLAVPQSHQ